MRGWAVVVLVGGCVRWSPSDPRQETGAGTNVETGVPVGDDTGGGETHVRRDACPSVTPICAAGACTYDIPVGYVTVSGTFSFGGAPPAAEYRVTFQDTSSGVEHTGSFAAGEGWRVVLVPGTYAVYAWTAEEGAYGQARLGTRFRDVVVTGDTVLDLTTPTVEVSGTFLLDGVATTGVDLGFTRLDGPPVDVSELVVRTTDGTFQAVLPPGRYHVEWYDDSTESSDDVQWRILTDVPVVEDTALALDVRTVQVLGAVRVNGETLTGFGTRTQPDWEVEYIDAHGTSELDYGYQDNRYTLDIPPGVYDVFVHLRDYGVPGISSGAVLVEDDLVVEEGGAIDLDATLFTLSGSITVDGAAPGSPISGTYDISLVDPETGVEMFSHLEGGAYTVSAPAGTYDVWLDPGFYRWGEVRMARGVSLTRDTALDLALQRGEIHGALRYEGVRLTAENVKVEWTDRSTGTTIRKDAERNGGSYNVRLLPGTYDVRVVVYDSVAAGHAFVVASGVVVAGDATVDLDLLKLYPVSGGLDLSGPAPTAETSGAEYCRIRFLNVESGDVSYANCADGRYDVDVPEGIYTVDVEFPEVEDATVCPHRVSVAACVSVGP